MLHVMNLCFKFNEFLFAFTTMIYRIVSRLITLNKAHLSWSHGKRLYRSRFSSSKHYMNPSHQFEPAQIETNDLDDDYYSFVPISIIKQFLLRRDIVYSDGPTCISIACPLCNVEKSPLFINKTSGSFICSNCKKTGNWNILELCLSDLKNRIDIPPDEVIDRGRNYWGKLLQQSVSISEASSRIGCLKNLSIPLNVLKEFNVRVNKEFEEIFFPLVYYNDPVGYISLKPDLSEETFPFKCAKGVVIRKRNKETAVVVATLKDFLALTNSPLKEDIICLPHREHTLPQDILPLFENYKKLILWFSNDSVSWGNMKMFAKKLVEERCSLIQPLENQPAPYECLKSGINVTDVIKNAQQISHTSIITFANLREDVLSELHNADKVSGVRWERFPVLNTILKGHRRGELTILTGPTGSGKTTFMSEYSLDLICSNVTTLWGSFEIRNQRLAKTMMTQMFSAPLDKNLDKFDEWADKFERLPLYFMTFHGQQPLETVMDAVKHATYVHDVVHVIIDNVQFMLGLSNNEAGFLDRFYRQDALIACFRNFATTYNCHVTLVIHPRKEKEAEQLTANSIFGGAKAAQEADNILIIQNKLSHSTFRTKKFLQIAKNRFCGDLGIMPLEFDKESLSFRSKKPENTCARTQTSFSATVNMLLARCINYEGFLPYFASKRIVFSSLLLQKVLSKTSPHGQGFAPYVT